jgi:hypothetical protein
MHAFVLSQVLLAALVALACAIALTAMLVRRVARRWPATRAGLVTVAAGYRDALHVRGGGEGVRAIPRTVIAVVVLAFAQFAYLVVAHVLFARTALALDLWRVRPVAVRLVIVQSVFVLPASLVYLRAAIALVRREADADARARFTAGAYLAIRAMRVVAGVAVASEFASGYVEWARVFFALPGFVLAIVAAGVMIRAADAADAASVHEAPIARDAIAG